MLEDRSEARAEASKQGAKNLRVKLPVEMILRLQEIRILEGRSVGEVVKAALEEYFAREIPPKKRS